MVECVGIFFLVWFVLLWFSVRCGALIYCIVLRVICYLAIFVSSLFMRCFAVWLFPRFVFGVWGFLSVFVCLLGHCVVWGGYFVRLFVCGCSFWMQFLSFGVYLEVIVFFVAYVRIDRLFLLSYVFCVLCLSWW